MKAFCKVNLRVYGVSSSKSSYCSFWSKPKTCVMRVHGVCRVWAYFLKPCGNPSTQLSAERAIISTWQLPNDMPWCKGEGKGTKALVFAFYKGKAPKALDVYVYNLGACPRA